MTSPDLTNSRRQLDKVTYTPLVLPDSADGSALQMAAAVDQLDLVPGEAAAAIVAAPASPAGAPVPVVTPATPESAADRVTAVLQAMGALAAATNASDRLAAANALGLATTDDLTTAAGRIRDARAAALTAAKADVADIVRDYRLYLIARINAGTVGQPPPATGAPAAQPPAAATQPPDAATQPPNASVQPPDAATQPPDAAGQPPDAAVRPPDAAGQPGTTGQPPAAVQPQLNLGVMQASPPAGQAGVVRATAHVAGVPPVQQAELAGAVPAAELVAPRTPPMPAQNLVAASGHLALPAHLGDIHPQLFPAPAHPAGQTQLPIGIPSLGHPHPQGLPAPVSPLTPELSAQLGMDDAVIALTAFAWAVANDATKLAAALAHPAAVIPAVMRADGATYLQTGLPFLIAQVARAQNFAVHLTQRNLQPIGLLHLESLVMTPLAVQRGELLYSLPLAPKEKVTLSHKEWTLREEEYTDFVQDYLQNYSERGVADSSDMAVATSSETDHTKSLSMTRPVTPGAATIADPVDTTTSSSSDVTSDAQSEEQSRRDTRQTTQKASAMTVRDQKISFTVNTVTGTEDFTSRLYENDNPDKVLLIEYFRRMRQWRNELYRTGIRLTYDVVLPDPGRMLRERWAQIDAIDAQLAAGFDFAPPPYAPDDGTAVNPLNQLAVSLDTSLAPPPDAERMAEQTHALVEDAVRDQAVAFSLTIPIDQGYRATSVAVARQLAKSADPGVKVDASWRGQALTIPSDGRYHEAAYPGLAQLESAHTVDFIAYKGALGTVRAWVNLVPTATAWQQWYNTAVGVLRQAAYARFNDQRDLLRQQRAALVRQLEAPDTVTLRRMEREQVMRLVLQWLFPDFVGAGQVYQDADAAKPDSWQPAMEYGEYIKFVHQAIDWDNALVLLYPYFWDNPANHAAKLYLDHPDAAHREFLRAGAARVVLAIRPGYEEEVVSLLDKGELGKLAPGSRFLPVIAAVRAAEAGFVTALDADLKPTAAGVPAPVATVGTLIGEWSDWTPTSALDIDVTMRPVLTG